jgi:guanylate kinase
MAHGALVVLSGPSGVGKSTLARRLARRRGFMLSISATTRRPRGAERHGREYFFLTRRDFRAGIRRGDFVEHAEIYGNFYGTPKAPLAEAVARGRRVVLDIDWKGHRQLRRLGLPTVSIFILPPDYRELERRLRGRRTESARSESRRLRSARHELKHRREYDQIIVNDRLDRAERRILSILRKRGVLR